jgi:hypothetical protein
LGAVATSAAGLATLQALKALVGASAITLAGQVGVTSTVAGAAAVSHAGVAAGALSFPTGPGGTVAIAGALGVVSSIAVAGARGASAAGSVAVSVTATGVTVPVSGARTTALAGSVAGSLYRSANKGAALAAWPKPRQRYLDWSRQMVPNFIPPPVWLPPIRAGEIDGRYMDCTPDLGPTGDKFPSISTLSIGITRQDGAAVTSNDLQTAGSAWPNVLDTTQLIPTFGFMAPVEAAGVAYNLTLTCDVTAQSRLFIRDWMMLVAPTLG